jgi:threonyl-tRNA synthetase
MVSVTFPDGARREYPPNTTGLDIAKGISPSLAKRTVAMALDGKLADLTDPIEHDAKIEFIGREDPRALELIRHDAAHVLAEAVQSLWPGTQVTIGPVIDNGFYYDFFRNQPFTPEDFDAIEKKMREIIARDKPFTKEVWSRDEAKKVFRDKGEAFKVELIDAIPEDQQIKIYKQGDWFDLCRGPHMTSTGKVGNAFKLMKVAGAYWRGDSDREMLSRIYGTAFAKQDELDAYLKQIEEAEKRDHRKLGREMEAGRCSRRSRTTSAASKPTPAMRRSMHRSLSIHRCGSRPATWRPSAKACSSSSRARRMSALSSSNR